MQTYIKQLVTVYTTPKVVGIRSPLIAIVYVSLVLLVWCAFLGSLHLDIRKIYQKHCPVHGVVLTKVKGFASTENLTDAELNVPNPNLYRRTWDPADIVYPPSGEGETGSFTIVTNMVITPNQTLGTCADDANSKCTSDSECEEGYWSPATHGVYTGKCLEKERNCEIRGWCPIEEIQLPLNGQQALLEDVQDFTVLLKNTVDFPGCSTPHFKNAPSYVSKEYLKRCRYNRVSDPLCPIFRIGDIVKWSGNNFTDVAILGGVFHIKMSYDCDLDFGRTVGDCRPSYEFLRLDDKAAGIFSGMNFRSAEFYSDYKRTLRKQFALKILIDLEGEGRTFDFFQLIMKFGATIGLFSVAPLTCNFLLAILNKMKNTRCPIGRKLSTVVAQEDITTVSKFDEDNLPTEVITGSLEIQKRGSVISWNESQSYPKHEYHVNRAFSLSERSEDGSRRDSFKSITE